MSAINFAINKIKSIGIPMPILEAAFLGKPNTFGIAVSIDKQIRDLVIEPIVLRDLNVKSGVSVILKLETCHIDTFINTLNEYNTIITVPFEVTNNRKILEPLELLLYQSLETTYSGNNMLQFQTDRVMRVNSLHNDYRAVTDMELIGPNTILVYDNIITIVNGTLKVMVENDKNLFNLSPRYYNEFYRLCLLATKAFIYNKLVIEADRGMIYNGHELGKFNEILDSYSSAIEEYEQLLDEKWGKIGFMMDRQNMSDFVRSMIGLI